MGQGRALRMKDITQPVAETRSETIFRHTRRMLHERRLSMETFAQRVVEIYHTTTPLIARTVEFKTDGDPFRCATTNAQRCARWMNLDISTRLPVDIEDSWIQALDEPYREECIKDLLMRWELLTVHEPDRSATGGLGSIARLSREFGEAIAKAGPILADGKVSAQEQVGAVEAGRELKDVISAATELLVLLEGQADTSLQRMQ
jgi:hypothetical protein